MPRRARQAGTEDDAAVPTKIQPSSTKPPLDFSTPQSLFESFIAPVTRDEFFSTYWEKKPLLIQRSDPNVQTYYQSLFPMQGLKHASGQGIYYGRDVNLCKCKDGKKVLLSRRGKASYNEIMKSFRNAKATIQFHQPQRYNDKLWQIMEKLECFFGTLVGCNVYITPSDSQGLPAHHDDVEVFILQVEGEKHWRLYEPIVPLAREYDVAPLDKVTTPTHEFLLKEGDMLYFPRGVIHQADTPAGSSHSTHVTISAYQNTSWADYLQDLMPALLRDAAKENVDLRKGIPLQQLLRVGPTSAGSTLAGLLKDLANRIDGGCQLRTCEMLRDFMGHRLPPFVEANAEKSVHPPNLKSTIRLKYPDYAAITVDHVPKMLDPTEELVIYVFHALNNNRESHMVSDTEESPPVSGLRFPLSHMDALKAIWENKLLHVKDLPLEGDRDKENLAISLWSEGLIENVHTVG
ncbi:PREDICTED: bifunctional lysine-specific demethylase and histidyl-hydroxylase MINA [Nanorana parkeri]|uniref:bifunctional lysine-specific demethylase and histidyl-hydroxylase MINA n=1 Tax=Nanorana parkeri TaxID=125878 RepID=UPI000854F95F|nr:PREDICTED: bifunctional lysine-specific demethylase and histidyl-hydroxylase MINA [Nanorana parkeri]